MLDRDRAGKISSSECFKIYESKTVQETYMEEIRMFNLFKQKDVEKDVFNFKWGHLLENFLHEQTDHLKGYVNQNYEENATIFNKANAIHCGTPDQYTLQNEMIVTSETKCPVTLKGLYNLIFPFYTTGSYVEIDGNLAIEMIKNRSKEGKKYFYQIISNAVLLEDQIGLESNFGELIVFMPYKSSIPIITKYATDFFTNPYYPIMMGDSETLPCILPIVKEHKDFFDLDDEYVVKEFHRIRFDISKETKDKFRSDLNAFTERTFPKLITA